MIVWKDKISGIIYIDDFYTGKKTYEDGVYRNKRDESLGLPNFERKVDTHRRFKENFQFFSGKSILDYGCGDGDFLKKPKILQRVFRC